MRSAIKKIFRFQIRGCFPFIRIPPAILLCGRTTDYRPSSIIYRLFPKGPFLCNISGIPCSTGRHSNCASSSKASLSALRPAHRSRSIAGSSPLQRENAPPYIKKSSPRRSSATIFCRLSSGFSGWRSSPGSLPGSAAGNRWRLEAAFPR